MADIATRLARLRFRAWHRGTREADFLIGGFFDRHHSGWGETEIAWFEELLEEDDVDVMAWAMATQEVPERFASPAMTSMQKLDYVEIPR
jgi:antitoxin CptB